MAENKTMTISAMMKICLTQRVNKSMISKIKEQKVPKKPKVKMMEVQKISSTIKAYTITMILGRNILIQTMAHTLNSRICAKEFRMCRRKEMPLRSNSTHLSSSMNCRHQLTQLKLCRKRRKNSSRAQESLSKSNPHCNLSR